ncbi:hypothetical protein F5146DRAFT_605174 [Armillaria mellea]|nr:hypothetical protein F5146DRAFT_605174 [Armillaria mellea]
MTKRKSRSTDKSLSRKHLSADYSTRRARKDATSNSDQNVDGIGRSDSQEISYQNMSDKGGRISESTRTSLSELQSEQLSIPSVVVSQVNPVAEHPSGQTSEAFDDSDYERFWDSDSESEYDTLPEVTISATIETGQAESTIKVPKQRNYIGQMPVIPSAFADIPCATLGIQGVLDRLNITLGTSHTLDTPSVFSVLEDCIVKNYNFGTAYGLSSQCIEERQ